MRAIPPVLIGDGTLISSVVPEPGPDEVVYNPDQVYVAKDVVISTTTHRAYTSLRGAMSNVTLSIGSPCVVTWRGHGLITGEAVSFETTGNLPTGIPAMSVMYASVTGSDTFNVAATAGGTALNSSGTQAGIHKCFASVNHANPLPVPPETQNDWWIESGTSNRHRMFDLTRNSTTVFAGPLNTTFAPGRRVNALAARGLVADLISVVGNIGTSDGPEAYRTVKDLRRRLPLSLREYCFDPFLRASSFIALDLPMITNLVLTVSLSRLDGGMVECDALLVGVAEYFGNIKYGTENDTVGFNTITRDDWRNATLKKGRTVETVHMAVEVERERVRKLLDLRDVLEGTPAFYFGIDDGSNAMFEQSAVLGVWQRFSITEESFAKSLLNLQIEEI